MFGAGMSMGEQRGARRHEPRRRPSAQTAARGDRPPSWRLSAPVKLTRARKAHLRRPSSRTITASKHHTGTNPQRHRTSRPRRSATASTPAAAGQLERFDEWHDAQPPEPPQSPHVPFARMRRTTATSANATAATITTSMGAIGHSFHSTRRPCRCAQLNCTKPRGRTRRNRRAATRKQTRCGQPATPVNM